MGPTSSLVTVQPGDSLVVDGVEDELTDSAVLGKAATSVSAKIWADWPERDGELVVLTCCGAGETGSAQENLVVSALRTD